MYVSNVLNEIDTSQTVVFSSNGSLLKTLGPIESVALSSSSDQVSHSEIQRVLQKMLEQGANNPIVIGAIGFDGRSEPQLFVAKDYQRIPVQDLINTDSKLDVEIESISQVTSRGNYEDSVRKALDLFEYTPLKKVVLSRSIDIKAQQNLKASQLFQQLLSQNQKAYVYSIPMLNEQTLIGASPELLIRKEQKQIVSNPLAGSAKLSKEQAENQRLTEHLLSSKKDLFEHEFVVNAVNDALLPYCEQLNTPNSPSVIRTPTMLHLSTEIDGQLKSENVDALELAYALHPTPAICGTPYQLAHQAITLLENYRREMFSGMVGWVDSKGNGEWAVTIRCGKVSKDSMRLYAGAGIVENSVPEAEWQETSAKLGTMLNAFGLNISESMLAEGLS